METLSWLIAEWGSIGWVRAAVIFLGSLIVAKLTDWVLCSFVSRLARRTKSTLDDKAVQVLHRPIFVTVVFIGMILALRHLALPARVEANTGHALKTLIVLVWLVAGIRLSTIILNALAERGEQAGLIDGRTIPLLDNTIRLLLLGAAAYFVFVIWTIDLTAWLASAGIIGIAVGFAAKDTLGNLFAGVFILIDAPYKVGDFIVLDQGERGKVTHIGIRSTRLLTRDDVEIIIPNSVIGGSKIINESGGPWEKYRVRIKVGVAYGSDVDQVREALTQIAESHRDVCSDPEPRVRFRAFGESSLDFELLVWIAEPVLRGRVRDALLTSIYKRFHEEGIEIPFPQRDLHIHPPPAPEAGRAEP